jgi:hypothetical protein
MRVSRFMTPMVSAAGVFFGGMAIWVIPPWFVLRVYRKLYSHTSISLGVAYIVWTIILFVFAASAALRHMGC